jgi:hypothetical protein
VAVRHHLDLAHTKPSALNGLDEEPTCVGQDRVRRSPVWIVADAGSAWLCAWPPVAGVEGQRYA